MRLELAENTANTRQGWGACRCSSDLVTRNRGRAQLSEPKLSHIYLLREKRSIQHLPSFSRVSLTSLIQQTLKKDQLNTFFLPFSIQ